MESGPLGGRMHDPFSPMGVSMRLEDLPLTTTTPRMVNPGARPDITTAASAIPTPDPGACASRPRSDAARTHETLAGEGADAGCGADSASDRLRGAHLGER